MKKERFQVVGGKPIIGTRQFFLGTEPSFLGTRLFFFGAGPEKEEKNHLSVF